MSDADRNLGRPGSSEREHNQRARMSTNDGVPFVFEKPLQRLVVGEGPLIRGHRDDAAAQPFDLSNRLTS
jgi:hypothetical protein